MQTYILNQVLDIYKFNNRALNIYIVDNKELEIKIIVYTYY